MLFPHSSARDRNCHLRLPNGRQGPSTFDIQPDKRGLTHCRRKLEVFEQLGMASVRCQKRGLLLCYSQPMCLLPSLTLLSTSEMRRREGLCQAKEGVVEVILGVFKGADFERRQGAFVSKPQRHPIHVLLAEVSIRSRYRGGVGWYMRLFSRRIMTRLTSECKTAVVSARMCLGDAPLMKRSCDKGK